jgi:hypothetical protein
MNAPHLREAAEAVRARVDAVCSDPAPEHEEIAAAVRSVVELRNRCIAECRAGRLSRERLERANAALSLAFGAEFPLMGLRLKRLARARDAIGSMFDGD